MSHPVSSIRQYIIDKNQGTCQFDDQDDLIENRLIDSLQFLDFVRYVEELSGKDINIEAINIDDFRSIANIQRGYLEKPAELAFRGTLRDVVY